LFEKREVPSKTPIIPKVAMNGESLNRVTRNPMKRPEARPIRIPKERAGINPRPFEREIPATIPQRDMRLPTERSIPFESMTRVNPREMIKRTDPWRIRLERFPTEKKLGETKENRTIKPVKR
jgi:hypothetical protein